MDLNYDYEILPEDCTQYDISFKLIVIGDSGINLKVCFLIYFVNEMLKFKYNKYNKYNNILKVLENLA